MWNVGCLFWYVECFPWGEKFKVSGGHKIGYHSMQQDTPFWQCK